MAAKKKAVKRAVKKLSFSEGVRAELGQIFKIDTNFKTQYKHLKLLGTLLKTRVIGTHAKKKRAASR